MFGMYPLQQPKAMSSSKRSKPLPQLPPIATRRTNIRQQSSGKPSSARSAHGARPPIDTSMISPPSMINPVSLEPHSSPFDQAFFIPANDCPSPVPSPVARSLQIMREQSVDCPGGQSSTTTSDTPCERSVWEADSDNESAFGAKHVSRTPIDTLRKVRSKVQLRVARTGARVHAPSPDEQAPPKLPPTAPDHRRGQASLEETCLSVARRRPSKDSVWGLRIVAPSVTSLLTTQNDPLQSRPQDLGCSAATTTETRFSQHPQRLYVGETCSLHEQRLVPVCREKCSGLTLRNDYLVGHRPPFLKRIWLSLQGLGCHGRRTSPSASESYLK